VNPLAKICAGGCGRLIPPDAKGSRCAVCYPEYNRRRNARPNTRVWNSPEWRRARVRVLDRDDHCCQRCGASEAELTARGARLAVHHMTPLSMGGDALDETNLITLCHSCHNTVESARPTRRQR
jgi:5-methylcytosine-specific restriction endonuclease McrA